ncbi:WD40 repeat domain-containing protein [Nostoc sp.]|uniref:WD40 repeat domain-containing protein n=1 Tax=Nostoc sp. TaxID=1180 RepID=UPI002FF98178
MTNLVSNERISYPLPGHQDAVNSISFSPDGKTIASGSWDKTIKLWNIESGESQTLSGHTDKVWRVRYSPMNGNMIASASTDNTVRLWNAKSGEFLGELKGNTDLVYDISFSPDSKKIATASWDGKIKIWDTTTKKELETLENLQGQNGSYSIDFHPHGAKLAVVGYKDGSVKVWDLNTKTAKMIGDHKKLATIVKFSHDGHLLASSSGDGMIKLWKDDQLLTTIKAHEKEIYGLAFSPNDQILASASEDTTIKLWQIDGILSKTLVAHGCEIYDISFSPNYEDDQLIASASEDTTIRLWKIILEEKFDGYAENVSFQEAYSRAIGQAHQRLYINPQGNITIDYKIDSKEIRYDNADNFVHSVSVNVTSFIYSYSRNFPLTRPCQNCKRICSPQQCKARIDHCCSDAPED